MNQMSKIEKDYAEEILQEAKGFYHKIKSIYDSTDYSRSFQLGKIWGHGGKNMGDMIGIINSDATAVDSFRSYQKIVTYLANQPDRIKEKTVDWYIAYLMRSGHDLFELDTTFQESPVANPILYVRKAGRLLTADFLRSLIHNLEIQKYCSISKSKFRIVELGGGRGYFARTLKLFRPHSVYVGIDLPETLYFAYIFLRLSFPNAKTCYVTDASQLKDGIQGFDFVFVPTMFAECILQDEFDLFVNTASLGEMPSAVTRYWIDFVQKRLKVKYFFGLNRFLNTIVSLPIFSKSRLEGDASFEGNPCSVLFYTNWKILHWEGNPLFARNPYEQVNVDKRNLEIVAERLPEGSTNESDNQLLSQQIVEDLMDEDWFRYRNRYAPAIIGGNVLTNDLTMSGTLFKLWESIRLYPNKTNVAMMIIYLRTLTKKGYPFDEWFYYKHLLKSLNTDTPKKQSLTLGITLLDEKYKGLWEEALSLSYNPSTTRARLLLILDYLPSFMRPGLIKLYRAFSPKRQ